MTRPRSAASRGLVLVPALVVLAVWSASSASSVAPLAKDGSVEAGGRPLENSEPNGVEVRFLERTLFGIGIVFHNTSRAPVTVVGATAVVPSRSIVGQVGTRLLSWNPPPCPPHIIGCVVNAFFHGPSASDRAEPVTVQSGTGLAVQLDFRVGSCSALPFASFAPVTAVTLFYEGRAQQTFELGGATLRLLRPPSGVCAPRPFSRLAIDGPFAGSTASTIPSSNYDLCSRTPIGSFLCDDADRCSRSGAGIGFRSGLFQPGDGPGVRVAVRLPRYSGTGRYGAGRNADVSVHVDIGPRGATYHAIAGFVTVTRASPGVLAGRLRATLSGFRRRPFHAFGTWACTLGAK